MSDDKFATEEPTFSWVEFTVISGLGLTAAAIFVSLAIWALGQSSPTRIILLGLFVLFFAVTVSMAPYLYRKVKVGLRRLRMYKELFDLYKSEKNEKKNIASELESLRGQIPHVEKLALEEGQKRVLASLRIRKIANQVRKLEVSGITNCSGTVYLVIRGGSNIGLVPGMRVEVRTRGANELWGVVELQQVEPEKALGFPIDRVNPDFWERLEDRMRYNSAPPNDIKLEPFIMDEIKDL